MNLLEYVFLQIFLKYSKPVDNYIAFLKSGHPMLQTPSLLGSISQQNNNTRQLTSSAIMLADLSLQIFPVHQNTNEGQTYIPTHYKKKDAKYGRMCT